MDRGEAAEAAMVFEEFVEEIEEVGWQEFLLGLKHLNFDYDDITTDPEEIRLMRIMGLANRYRHGVRPDVERGAGAFSHREVLCLAFEASGMSHAQIAGRVGVEARMVSVYLARARKKYEQARQSAVFYEALRDVASSSDVSDQRSGTDAPVADAEPSSASS